MILLTEFTILRPDPGLILWTTLFFLIFWYFIGKNAFKPMGEALRKRTHDIQKSLDQAEEARKEMANLQSENEKILREAQAERAEILVEAKTTRDQIIKEAKVKANDEAQKIIVGAKQEIENQRAAAMAGVKDFTGSFALEIAEKLMKGEMKSDGTQQALVNKMIAEINLS